MRFFDPDLLRTYVAFVDTGSLSRAAEIVGRSPSAVTAQMQRLEETVGTRLLAPAGRGRVLTIAGEELVGHARRILDAHRQAALSLKGASSDGHLAIAATQDFADRGLPKLLRLFAATHPRLRLDLRIGRSAELGQAFENGDVDVLLAMRGAASSDEIGVLREPMVWLAASEGLAVPQDELPLALLDGPCAFRSAALSSLDAARRPYRIASTSQSLAGLRAAVSAGLAVSLRTARWIGPGVGNAPASMGLPKVTDATFSIRVHSTSEPFAYDLGRLLQEGLASGY